MTISLTARYALAVAALSVLTLGSCSLRWNAQARSATAASSTLAFTNATVVDVETGLLHPRYTLIVTGNRIAAVGSVTRVSIPAGARVVDATGKYLVPGLMDTHVHLWSEWTNPPIDTSAYFGWILAGGVTSVREMSPGGFEQGISWRAAVAAGRLLAPRIYVSAGPDPALGQPWSRLFQRIGVHDGGAAIRKFPALGIDGLKLLNFPRDTMLSLVKTARAAGVPVYGHTVFSSPDRPPTYENFTMDLVRAGLSGVVHVTGTMKPTGVDNHSAPTVSRTTAEGRRAWWFHNRTAWKRTDQAALQALIDTMVARHVWYEPTRLVDFYWFHQDLYDTTALSPHHPWRSREQSRMMADPEIRVAVLESEAAQARFIKRFYDAGGMVLAGSDEVPLPPFGVTEEVRLLVEAGLPPLAALQAATINAARAMHWEDRLGSIEVGKLADLVLLDADPLADITNVRRIHAVVADGRFLDRATLDAFLRRVQTPVDTSRPPNNGLLQTPHTPAASRVGLRQRGHVLMCGAAEARRFAARAAPRTPHCLLLCTSTRRQFATGSSRK